MCSLLTQLKEEYPNNNKPHHFTRLKEKQSELCRRRDNKSYYKKFKIGNDEFLICAIFEIFNPPIYYRIYLKSDGGISLYKTLGVKGKWYKIYQSGDSHYELTKEENNVKINKVSNDLKEYFQKININLTEQQIRKIIDYSKELYKKMKEPDPKKFLVNSNLRNNKYETIGEKNKNYENI